jgi:hypothetical protein
MVLVELNGAEPLIVTIVPTGPLVGEICIWPSLVEGGCVCGELP